MGFVIAGAISMYDIKECDLTLVTEREVGTL